MEIKERIARALSRAGTSVTVTTLTNSCAFFVGSLTETLALRYFAYWAGMGIIFDFLLQTTFFVACLTYDARRQQAKRCDVLSCIETSPLPGAHNHDTSAGRENVCGIEDGVLQRFFERKYARFILSRWYVQAGLMSIAVGVFMLCIFGTTRLTNEFDISYFYMPGSRAYKYEQADNEYFEMRPEIWYYIFTGDYDYADRDNQLAMNRLFDPDNGAIASDPYYRDESLRSWYNNFREFANLTEPQQLFSPEDYYPLLNQYLTTTEMGNFFAKNIVMEQERMIATKSIARFVSLETNEDEVDAMHSLRNSVDSAGVEDAFAFGSPFIYLEGDSIIKDEAVKSALLSLTAVFVVTLVLVGHLYAASIVLLGVGFSVIDLLGFMNFFDINLNTVSVISLALAVGLTIDFSAHIGLVFMSSVGNKRERVEAALSHLGPALMHGGFTTILIIGVLGFSESYVFNVFFKVILMIISLGMFHGMVIVPIVLHWIGPESYFSSADEARNEENAFVAKMLNRNSSNRGLTSNNNDMRTGDVIIDDGGIAGEKLADDET
uniref:SSD domain-containing protein n=1 Tax=Leptocylindrus danicus TaxID=163516 RepID=A0A7S2LTG5_9STRA